METASRVIELSGAPGLAVKPALARAGARGFSKFMLCVNAEIQTPQGPQSAPAVTVCDNLDCRLIEDWSRRRYTQDPLRRMSAAGTLDRFRNSALLWENLDGRISLPGAKLTSSEAETMHLAYRQGIRTGVNVPLPIGGSPAAVIVSFFSERKAQDLEGLDDSIAILFYLAHAVYRDLAPGLRAQDGTRPRLTPRERECLQWVARGKTAAEIGIILHLSNETIRDHIKRTRSKLGATTRAEAIARAVALGELTSG